MLDRLRGGTRRARVLRARRVVACRRARARGARLGRPRARELRAHVRLRASATGATATRAGSTSTRSPTTTRRRARLNERSPHAAGGPIGCAAYDMGRLLGEGIAAVGPSDPGRHRRRAAPREAAARDERLRRHADGLRHVGARGAQGPLPRPARVARRSLGSGLTPRTIRTMAQRPDAARLRIARAGLTQTAVERVSAHVVRADADHLGRPRPRPVAPLLLEGPWSAEDDAALVGAVGPGEGWYEEELDPGIRLASAGGPAPSRSTSRRRGARRRRTRRRPSTRCRSVPPHERTLGDTFEDAVVLEPGRNPAELCSPPVRSDREGRPVHARGPGLVRRGRRVVPRVRRDRARASRARLRLGRAVGRRTVARHLVAGVRHDRRRVRAAARHPTRPPVERARSRSSARSTCRTRATSRGSSTRPPRPTPRSAVWPRPSASWPTRCWWPSPGRTRSRTRHARCGARRSARSRTSPAPTRVVVRARARRQGRLRALLRATRPGADRRRPGRSERRTPRSTPTCGCGSPPRPPSTAASRRRRAPTSCAGESAPSWVSHLSVMLRRMETIEGNDLVSAAFEACAAFRPAGSPAGATPVCAACGWLDHEHEHPGAEVRILAPARRRGRRPTRLAS